MFPLSRLHLLQAETKFPDCVNFIYDFQDKGIFFGVSPETLFKIEGRKLYSEALAGTFKSSSSIKPLKGSKELDEHNFVVEYLKEKISEISNDIKWNQAPELIHLNKMSHLKTKFTSKIKNNINPFKIIFQCLFYGLNSILWSKILNPPMTNVFWKVKFHYCLFRFCFFHR